MTAAALYRVLVLIVFAGALALTIQQHVQYATSRRSRTFFAFLETSGWLVLTLASGVAVFRAASPLLSIAAGGAGLLFVLIGALLRPPDRA